MTRSDWGSCKVCDQ